MLAPAGLKSWTELPGGDGDHPVGHPHVILPRQGSAVGRAVVHRDGLGGGFGEADREIERLLAGVAFREDKVGN
jgi:hypothetical protein